MAGALILLLLAAFPLAAAAGHIERTTYSGDDAYDPAAGRFAPRSAGFAVTYSGDDAYDPAAGRSGFAVPSAAIARSYSGDDAYDPAAGGLPALVVFTASQGGVAACAPAGPAVAGLYSGDDAYDPAAAGSRLPVC